MKKLCIVILLLTITISTQEAVLTKKITLKRADFRTTLIHILKHEGYYANHPDDKGGETYSGITRRWNPEWQGWKFIDKAKPLHQCDSIGGIVQYYVLDYYLDIWIKEGFYLLKDQRVANYVFDFRINGTIGTLITKRALIDLGFKIPLTNEMDEETIKVINRANKEIFLKKLRKRRINFYISIAQRDTTQKKFLNHWLERSNN